MTPTRLRYHRAGVWRVLPPVYSKRHVGHSMEETSGRPVVDQPTAGGDDWSNRRFCARDLPRAAIVFANREREPLAFEVSQREDPALLSARARHPGVPDSASPCRGATDGSGMEAVDVIDLESLR